MSSDANITIDLPAELKLKIEQAAAKRGVIVTRFVNAALERAADRTLSRVRRRELSECDQQALLDLLAEPSRPNAALKRAADRYRHRYGG